MLGYATADMRNPCGVFTALEDMSQAVRLICEMDSESPLFLLGFSAGGHLCALFANVWKQEEEKGGENLRPAGTVLCYPALSFDKILHGLKSEDMPPEMSDQLEAFQALVRKGLFGSENAEEDMESIDVISKVNQETPASFVWGTMEDELINPDTLFSYQKALEHYGTECRLTMFEKGNHGLSLAAKETAFNENMINEEVAGWVEAAAQWMKEKAA